MWNNPHNGGSLSHSECTTSVAFQFPRFEDLLFWENHHPHGIVYVDEFQIGPIASMIRDCGALLNWRLPTEARVHRLILEPYIK
jgi:hypothetical protein